MKSSACVVFGIAGILLALQAPSAAQGMPPGAQVTPATYMGLLRQASAALPALPLDAASPHPSADTRKAMQAAKRPMERWGTAQSFIGNTDGAIATFDGIDRTRIAERPASIAERRLIEDAVAEDAIKAIVAEARNKRVVLLNEAHHVPMHRAFSQKLAAELRKIGYTYLACEAFDNGNMPLLAGGYANATSGYYMREPVFAGFINSALADGWTPVAYESSTHGLAGTPFERLQQRETGQAQNLVDRIFAKDKDAKVFIHVGYGHLYKSPNGTGLQAMGGQLHMMGEQLRRMTKLDTLHVEQTEFYAHPNPADEHPLYPLLLNKFPSTEPFVLRSKDGSFPLLAREQGMVDMQVVFPRYGKSDGRPDWLASLAGRQPREIPAELLPAVGKRLVLAYGATHGPDATPVDIVMVEAGKPIPKLMLPKGEFRFAVED